MADADRDKMLKEMAANRGCHLVKSRRRKPGVGDYGHYGLKDSSSGREVLGFSSEGLTATADEVEAFLRKGSVADWKSSLISAVDPPPPPRSRQPAAPRRRRGKVEERQTPAPTPAEPNLFKAKPKLRIVENPPPTAPATPSPPQASRRVLKIREGRPADAEGIARLVGADEPSDVRSRLVALRNAGEPPLVAEEGGEILGCLAFHLMPLLHQTAPLGRITLLIVAEEARRRGIGRALVEEAEARLSESGCTRFEALAEIELAAAPDFYRRLGWTRSFYRYSRDLEA